MSGMSPSMKTAWKSKKWRDRRMKFCFHRWRNERICLFERFLREAHCLIYDSCVSVVLVLSQSCVRWCHGMTTWGSRQTFGQSPVDSVQSAFTDTSDTGVQNFQIEEVKAIWIFFSKMFLYKCLRSCACTRNTCGSGETETRFERILHTFSRNEDSHLMPY